MRLLKRKNRTKVCIAGSLILALIMAVCIPVLNPWKVSAGSETSELISWNFDENADGWYYGEGWEYQYDGAANSSVSYDDGMLKATVDYSANAGDSWSQMAVCYYDSEGMNLDGANKISFDFIYDSSKLSGGFGAKVYSNAGIDANVSVDTENSVDISDTLKKSSVAIEFDQISETAVNDIALCLIGNETSYKGDIWIDNIVISSTVSSEEYYVNSTKKVTGGENIVELEDNKLVTYDNEGNKTNTKLSGDVTLVDENATEKTKQIYAYLKAIGESDSIIFGQQNNTHHKAGSKELSYSDTYDVVGSYTGVIGIDSLSLLGNEYSASKCNEQFKTSFKENAYGNIQAAAYLTNENIKNGAIITLSTHMPNFSIVNQVEDDGSNKSYSTYDFKGYSPNTLTGDVMNNILPGGKYNKEFEAYLDVVADYASLVDGAVLFRPFHENTGSWFWWGAALCDAETYKNVYKYTVEYLRDEKGVDNFIYVYGPGSEAATTDEYEVRYPGDEYVDMLGFDMYHQAPSKDDIFMENFQKELNIVKTVAQKHGKIFAVTETGVANEKAAGDNQTALLKTGNERPDWYKEILDLTADSGAAYFLVWANFGEKDGFYTPYVKSVNEDGTLYGHEMLDNFIQFFNDPRSIFAINQKDVLSKINDLSINVSKAAGETTGYIVNPVAGKRILEKSSILAKVTGKANNVSFVLHGNVDKTINAEKTDDLYTATIDEDTLKSLGEIFGTVDLVIDGKIYNTIKSVFNIPEPEQDPYEIDGFENYLGVDSLLTKAWATNKASGSTINISLTNEEGKYYDGNYGLKFEYNETSDGWAGAVISKEVDWSDCNALSFWTIPDGNNQKIVIQITANSYEYEAYLNLYDEYKDVTTPILVTIPFSEFVDRDGDAVGGLEDNKAYISSCGLWLNAIGDSEAIDEDGRVSGVIYYDDITAISTNKTEATFEKAEDTSSEGSNENSYWKDSESTYWEDTNSSYWMDTKTSYWGN